MSLLNGNTLVTGAGKRLLPFRGAHSLLEKRV